MSFLKRLRQSQASTLESWRDLTDMPQLDQIARDSFDLPIVIFKHSVTCGISAAAKHRLEHHWDEISTEIQFYYLDLLSYRLISTAIADRWQVRHQSPQIIIIKEDKAVYNTSHHLIEAGDIERHLSL